MVESTKELNPSETDKVLLRRVLAARLIRGRCEQHPWPRGRSSRRRRLLGHGRVPFPRVAALCRRLIDTGVGIAEVINTAAHEHEKYLEDKIASPLGSGAAVIVPELPFYPLNKWGEQMPRTPNAGRDLMRTILAQRDNSRQVLRGLGGSPNVDLVAIVFSLNYPFARRAASSLAKTIRETLQSWPAARRRHTGVGHLPDP